MAKSSKAAASETTSSENVERLTDAINRMADELRVARDVMDDIREDLSWVTRNGIPGHHEGPTQVVRMARDPTAADANERLELRLNHRAPDKFDELVSEIAEIVTGVGQEQLDLLLAALDSARDKLLTAIKSPNDAHKSKAKSAEVQLRSQSDPPPKPSGHGHLF